MMKPPKPPRPHIDVEYTENFSPPETVKETLIAAREIIRDEQRWNKGSLFAPPEDVYYDICKKNWVVPKLITCNNVRVCAIGAIALVRFNGKAVDTSMNIREEPIYNALADDPISKECITLLDIAAHEFKPRSANYVQLGDNIGTLNDCTNLENVIKAFDMAIETIEESE